MRRIILEKPLSAKSRKKLKKTLAEPKKFIKKATSQDKLTVKLLAFGVHSNRIEPLLKEFSEKDILYALRYYDNQRRDYEDKAAFVEEVCNRCIEKRKLKGIL